MVAKPYDSELKRIQRAVAIAQLIIDVLAQTGEDADHPAAKVRVGIDTGKALAVNNGRLANVFVYVRDGLGHFTFPAPSEPAVLDQRGCRYVPHVLGLMAGQPLKILNSDLTEHNVHPMPKNNGDWNESQMARGAPLMKTFQHPEIMMPVQCNQHPWMKAYVNVLPHTYFAVTAPDGSFQIKDLPPGEYTLAAVHEKLGEQTVKVKVSSKEVIKTGFTFVSTP